MALKKGLIGAVIAAAVLGVVAGGVVLAQTNSPGGSGANAQSPSGGNGAGARARIDNFLNQLAQNLHIDRPTLDNALKTTAKQQVDQAVAAGRLTQDQANQDKQRIDNGQSFLGIGRLGRGERGGARGATAACGAGVRDAVTNTLGISAGDLRQARANGKTIAQIAQEHGKTVEDLRNAVAQSAKGCLDQQVQSGSLTAQQEQDILQRLQDRATSSGGGHGNNQRHGAPSSRGGSQ